MGGPPLLPLLEGRNVGKRRLCRGGRKGSTLKDAAPGETTIYCHYEKHNTYIRELLIRVASYIVT